MKKLVTKHPFVSILILIIFWTLLYFYWPLSEKEQIKEQKNNLDYWLFDVGVDSQNFQYRGKKRYKSEITGKTVDEFEWFYREKGREIQTTLPIIKRRSDINWGKGPSIGGNQELWKELRNRETKKRHPKQYNQLKE